ncbi:MAG: hypothetical protein CMN02_13940 [Roseibacillus sp.]|nr:hypothetical protein [Roseibacillus sp.]
MNPKLGKSVAIDIEKGRGYSPENFLFFSWREPYFPKATQGPQSDHGVRTADGAITLLNGAKAK